MGSAVYQYVRQSVLQARARARRVLTNGVLLLGKTKESQWNSLPEVVASLALPLLLCFGIVHMSVNN